MISPSQKRIEEVKVGISNPVAKKIELHKPMNQAVFFHNGTMYSITTEKGDLVVSPKHKVYIANTSYLDSLPSSLQSCLVDIPTPISKSRFSYVHILQFLQRLSATKSSSFSWAPRSCFALGMNSAYRSDGTNIILLKSKELNSVNSFLESLDFCNISFLFL